MVYSPMIIGNARRQSSSQDLQTIEADRQKDRQTDTKTDRQTQRQTDRQTLTNRSEDKKVSKLKINC
jgi:hypothetical protein